MADLPEYRITVDERTFRCTGMNYFGPFKITRERSLLKRYGVLFTCIKTRAVHLEVASSLITDSCISAIRCFIARRGPVEMISSDNGTNLVANRELKKVLKVDDTEKMQGQMLTRNIDWRFNPPAASHFGGVWERMIRSTRKVLYGVLREQPIKMYDEGLVTLFCEAEILINSRPLTINQDSPDDVEPLTPNHFLVGIGQITTAPGVFTKKDIVKGWRQVQYLTNLFWKRWSTEYITTLQERQQWSRRSYRRNVMVGDIVLFVDQSPRRSWPMARVTEVHKDQKNIVRSVKLKAKSSTLTCACVGGGRLIDELMSSLCLA